MSESSLEPVSQLNSPATETSTVEVVHHQRHTNIFGNLIRGALIGAVETIPGVSGGTVALVTGVYDELIESANFAIGAFKALILGPDRLQNFKNRIKQVNWLLVLPIVLGMGLAVLALAGPISGLVETKPEFMRALFLGMVLGSVLVPLGLAGGPWRSKDVIIGVCATLFAFVLVSLPATNLQASPLFVFPAAALAVSALMLPGISGSFILLTLGLYQPTLQAVSQRHLSYLAIFALGALTGGVLIIKILQYLLAHHYRATMIALSGLMLGALRSLWPWQSEAKQLLTPGQNWLPALGLFCVGLIIVQVMIRLDKSAKPKP